MYSTKIPMRMHLRVDKIDIQPAKPWMVNGYLLVLSRQGLRAQILRHPQ